jgi:EAL domain-containing protein (putative c-di-GMP-specific phosphodiesterase class I)
MTTTSELETHAHAPTKSDEESAAPVLIVDDDPRVAVALKRVLEARGFVVELACDGQDAIELVKRKRYDAILTDIQMPHMTGVDLLAIVRAYDLDVPVLLMTGEPKLESAIEAVSLGALQYLVKPIANEVMVEAVERASRLRRIARAKRESLELNGRAHYGAGDRAGLTAGFEQTLKTLALAFQPIVHAGRGAVYGYEALMRPAEKSMPSPETVLAAAQRLGRLPEIGRRVRSLCAAAARGAPDGPLFFVNMHPCDLLDEELFRTDAPLSAHAARVVLEVTERSTLDDVQDVRDRVRRLRDLGYRIAIDDLGAGYSGLASFAALEPDIVKLDISLIRGIDKSPMRQRIVGTMAALCSEMQIRVIAEGVECAEEKDTAQRLGCDLLQGYFFGRPGPAFPVVECIAAAAAKNARLKT